MSEGSTSIDPSSGKTDLRGIIFVLRVSEGPDTGATLLLDGLQEGRILVGTSRVCDLRLTDPHASRRHLALRRERDAWRVEDLSSTNGTRVNGVRVREAFVTGGELIAVGGSTLRLMRAGVGTSSVPTSTAFGRFLGASEAIAGQHARWAKLAASDVPIVIEGESGSGKELLAESLHEQSPSAGGPFVVFECARARDGKLGISDLFESASGGTLVVDEPSELDLAMQDRLLEYLARASVRARLVTTSRADLDAEVEAGRFREALLDRLRGAAIELPPLHRRGDDATLLASALWTQLGGAGALPADLLARCRTYKWPGNVRELASAVAERLGRAHHEPSRATSSIPPADVVARVIAERLPFARAREEVLRSFEERFVEAVLSDHGGNVSRAAASSGLARRYFQILRARTLVR